MTTASWIKMAGTPGQTDYLGGHAVWNNNQYVSNGNPSHAKIYEWDGGTNLVAISDSKGLAANTNLVWSDALNRFVATFGFNIALHNGVTLPWDPQNPSCGFYGEQLEEVNTIVVAAKGASSLRRTDGTNVGIASQSASGNLSAAINFDGKFYVTDINGYLWEYNGTNLILKSQAVLESIISLVVHNSVLYGASSQGRLFRWNGSDTWVTMADNLPSGTPIVSLLSHNGFFFGARPDGIVYMWNGVDSWNTYAPDGETWTLAKMFSYNGSMYCVGYGTGGGLFKMIPDNYIDLLSRGIPSAETWGMPNLPSQVFPNPISSAEAFGLPVVNKEWQIIGQGIQSGEAWGTPGLEEQTIIYPWPITTSELWGSLTLKKTSKGKSSLPGPTPDKEGDIRFVHNSRDGYGDILLADRDFDRDAGFETAVTITMGTDQRAQNEDSLPDDGGYKGGWWGDGVPVVPEDRIGTRLWLLRRSKGIGGVIADARKFITEGFQWMIDDGIIETLNIDIERSDEESNKAGDSVLKIDLEFIRPGGQDVFYTFYYNWQAQILRRG